METASLRALLAGLIDFAGLFPPAKLGMEQAVRNYAEYKASEEAWMLGRFIVPVARLEELEQAAHDIHVAEASTFHLSVLSNFDHAHTAFFADDLKLIADFNGHHAHTSASTSPHFRIDALEIKISSPGSITEATEMLRTRGDFETAPTLFFEVPDLSSLNECIDHAQGTGACLKLRTGGVVAEMFPASKDVCGFVAACTKAGVPFKATAGLHHPLPGTYPFTYEPNSQKGAMHGFLNVFLLPAFLAGGANEKAALELLNDHTADAFDFQDDAVTWRGKARASVEDVRSSRETLAHSFGSCSFTEPIEDLRALTLL